MKSRVVFFRMEEEDYERLAQLSIKEHRSISDIARSALVRSLDRSDHSSDLVTDKLSGLIAQLRILHDALSRRNENTNGAIRSSEVVQSIPASGQEDGLS